MTCKMKLAMGLVLFLFIGLSVSPLWAGIAVEKEWIKLQDILDEAKLNKLKIDRKIEHSDLIVSTLIREADRAEAGNDQATAILYAERAIRFSPESPLPHFFLSHLYGFGSQDTILNSLSEYLTALRLSLNDFWFLSSSIGFLGIGLFGAVVLSSLTFLLYGFIHYIPQWVHCAYEQFSEHIEKGTILIIFIFFLFLILFVAPPFWFFLFSLLIFFVLGQPKEKKAALVCLVSLFLLTILLTPFSIFLMGKQFPLLNQMAKNQQGDFLWFPPFPEKIDIEKTADWKVPFIKASYRLSEGDITGAEQLYQESLLKNPNDPMILNNLGNIYFYQNKLKQALDYYQKSAQIDPDYIVAKFNISQVYNEKLEFEEGKKRYLEGKAIDADQINDYAQRVATYPNYPVIEGRFKQIDLWKQFLQLNIAVGTTQIAMETGEKTLWRIWVGDISYIIFLALSLAVALFCVLLYRYLSRYDLDCSVCPFCLKAICERCQKSFSSHKVCADCGSDIKGMVGKKVGKTSKEGYPFYLLPGGAQLPLKAPMLALALLIPFYFFVTLLIGGDLFSSSSYWHLSFKRSPLFLIIIVVLYGISTSTLLLRKKR